MHSLSYIKVQQKSSIAERGPHIRKKATGKFCSNFANIVKLPTVGHPDRATSFSDNNPLYASQIVSNFKNIDVAHNMSSEHFSSTTTTQTEDMRDLLTKIDIPFK